MNKKGIFLFLPHNFFLLILFAISLFLLIKLNLNSSIPLYVHESVPDAAFNGILNESLTISLDNVDVEKINSEKDINSICLLFATYNKKTHSIYNFKVYQNEALLYEKEFNSHILNDGQYECFSLPNAGRENIHDFKIEISPIKTDINNVITIFKNSSNNQAIYKLVHTQSFFSVKFILCLITLLFFFIINYLFNTKKWNIQTVWVLFSLFYIIPTTFIIPPYQIPDEPRHYYTAYRLTQYDFNKDFYANMESHDFLLPNDNECVEYSGIQVRNKVIDGNLVKNCIKNRENVTTNIGYEFVAPKIAYFASALGIKLADIITNSPLIIFYLGRLFNALFCIFIIYKALTIAPKHKELLLLIATIPMFVQQMVSYSYDANLNCFSLLAIAVILRILYNKNIGFKDNVLLLICGTFIAAIKWNYLPLFLLLLFIPEECFNRKIDKYIYCFSIIVSSYLLGILCNSIFIQNSFKTILGCIFTLLSIYLSAKLILGKVSPKKNFILNVIFLLLIMIGISCTNSIYLLIPTLLLLFYPSDHKKYLKFIFVPILFFILFYFGKFLSTMLFSDLANIAIETNASLFEEIFSLILHPKMLLRLMYNTIKVYGLFYFQGLIGYFGWFGYKLDDLYILVYIAFFIYVLIKSEFVKTHWYDKLINLFGIFAGAGGIFLVMYLYWSSHDIPYIDGVQGRYFIPFVMPILLLCISSKNKKVTSSLEQNCFHFINIILFVTVATLLLCYY